MIRGAGKLLALDAGYPRCHAAVLIGGLLRGFDTVALDSSGSICGVCPFDHVVVEVPQVRPDTPDANDLLRIATTGVRLAERYASNWRNITEYRPTEWKGSTPKPPHHARMWEALTPAERKLLGGEATRRAIVNACKRGAKDRWQKQGSRYYRASELPTVNGVKITHDILDAVALALYAVGRIPKG